MKTSYIKIGFIALSMSAFSNVAFANHPLDTSIKIDRDSIRGVRLGQVQLRHLADGEYRLSGEVRRRQNNPVPMGHFDLMVSDQSDHVIFEDSEFYWPRIVNRRYHHPSKFVFTLPESIATQAELQLSFHKDKLAKRPKPNH